MRCTAPIKTSAWYPTEWDKENNPVRCRYNAKNGQFCGVHAHLANFIVSIIWKEDLE